MNTVIIVPIEKPRCPQCDKTEEKITACKHCGYQYPESLAAGIFGGLFVLGCIAFLVWAVLYLLHIV